MTIKSHNCQQILWNVSLAHICESSWNDQCNIKGKAKRVEEGHCTSLFWQAPTSKTRLSEPAAPTLLMMPIYNKSCRGLTGHEISQFLWNPWVRALPTSTTPLKHTEQSPPAQALLLEFTLKTQESPFCLAGICSSNTANLISTIFLQSSGAYHLDPCLENAVTLHEAILTQDIRIYHTKVICYLSAAVLLQVSLLNANDKWH